jgi:hypothetical protein
VDLAALKHLPLDELHLDDTGVADLAPLEGSPLTILTASRTRIANLEPLQRSPLVELRLAGCTKLTSLEPLQACKDLERLVMPIQCVNIAFLRKLPSLRFLAYEKDGADPAEVPPANQFWLAADAAKPNEQPDKPSVEQPSSGASVQPLKQAATPATSRPGHEPLKPSANQTISGPSGQRMKKPAAGR